MPDLARFGPFEVDLESAELRRNGRSVRLPDPQFQILRMLLLESGHEVSRDDIRRKVWPNYTAVELDISVTAAILDLRLALGDTADRPAFIETLARRGYRLMVPVQLNGNKSSLPPAPEARLNSLVIRKVSNYRVRGVLGSAMGLLFKGEDPRLTPQVTLKFKAEELAADASARQNADPRTAALLSQPSLCTIYEVEDHEGVPSVVMELLEGDTLHELIGRYVLPADEPPRGLPLGQLLDIAIEIAGALAAAHQKGTVFGDINPANLFVTPAGKVRILEAGRTHSGPEALLDALRDRAAQPAAPPGQSPLTIDFAPSHAVIAKGTPGYMSPEQFLGEILDTRTDMFSFGLTLFEMATGQRPFPGRGEIVQNAILFQPIPSVRDLNPELPVGLEEIIRQALERDRDLRSSTAAEMMAGLKRLKAEVDAGMNWKMAPSNQNGARAQTAAAPAGVDSRRSPQTAAIPNAASANGHSASLASTGATAEHPVSSAPPVDPPSDAPMADSIQAGTGPESRIVTLATSAAIETAPSSAPPDARESETAQIEGDPEPQTADLAEEEHSGHWRAVLGWTAGILVLAGLGAAAYYYYMYLPRQKAVSTLRVTKYDQLTHDGQIKDLRGTDGSRLYFTQDASHAQPVAEINVSGGPIVPIPLGLPNSHVADVSPDGSTLLIRSFAGGKDLAYPLWSIRAADNSMRHLPDAFAANWSPDGQSIVYSTAEGGIFLIRSDGTGQRKLADVGSPASSFSWSPDGGAIRFSKDGKLWEMSSSGSNPLQLLPDWRPSSWECCGRWAADGRFYFLSDDQIWMLNQQRGPAADLPPQPVQLTFGPIAWGGPIPARDGNSLFASGVTRRGELLRFDSGSKQFQPFLGGISSEFVSFSKDGNMVAWVSYPEGILWRANRDGSDPVQLTTSPLYPRMPRWSPDGSQILFETLPPGGSHVEIEIVPSQGGKPRQLLPEDGEDQTDPDWSPDGRLVVYSTSPEVGRYPKSELRVFDLDNQKITTLPESVGMYAPRWSPDGKLIAAKTFDGSTLKVYTLSTRRWWKVRNGVFTFPAWSQDSRYIYFLDPSNSPGVYRIPARGGRPERIADLKDMHSTGFYGAWMGLDPTDSPLLLRDAGGSDIYALTLEQK
jgi:serine/threonine protein kinase/Tol biopolymer transport system component